MVPPLDLRHVPGLSGSLHELSPALLLLPPPPALVPTRLLLGGPRGRRRRGRLGRPRRPRLPGALGLLRRGLAALPGRLLPRVLVGLELPGVRGLGRLVALRVGRPLLLGHGLPGRGGPLGHLRHGLQARVPRPELLDVPHPGRERLLRPLGVALRQRGRRRLLPLLPLPGVHVGLRLHLVGLPRRQVGLLPGALLGVRQPLPLGRRRLHHLLGLQVLVLLPVVAEEPDPGRGRPLRALRVRGLGGELPLQGAEHHRLRELAAAGRRGGPGGGGLHVAARRSRRGEPPRAAGGGEEACAAGGRAPGAREEGTERHGR
mmetsp:Transcript_121971/g.345705  ORF Transcript_121971/g.345705 Transcript_121971/m.345705 type:complete len:317 (-) Transcript_121971:73-1023(-)